jgi:hypothetical protein
MMPRPGLAVEPRGRRRGGARPGPAARLRLGRGGSGRARPAGASARHHDLAPREPSGPLSRPRAARVTGRAQAWVRTHTHTPGGGWGCVPTGCRHPAPRRRRRLGARSDGVTVAWPDTENPRFQRVSRLGDCRRLPEIDGDSGPPELRDAPTGPNSPSHSPSHDPTRRRRSSSRDTDSEGRGREGDPASFHKSPHPPTPTPYPCCCSRVRKAHLHAAWAGAGDLPRARVVWGAAEQAGHASGTAGSPPDAAAPRSPRAASPSTRSARAAGWRAASRW